MSATDSSGSSGNKPPLAGHPERRTDLDVLPGFVSPPAGYGEVPFYWWMGDTLTKERITWQLDQLEGQKITGLQVNYAHSDEGGLLWGLSFPSDPPLFSDSWWELFGWFQDEAKKRGMSVSLSDYTLGSPGQGWYTDAIIAEHPDICGSTLEFSMQNVSVGDTVGLQWKAETLTIAAWRVNPQGSIETVLMDGRTDGDEWDWACPEGHWEIIEVFAKKHPVSIDPMNPLSGKKVIEKFFQPFEDRNPGEAGKSLNFFFSDELDFGISGNLWNGRFAEEFKRRKGYDLVPELPALFRDWGTRTAKVRLDYRDVLVKLEEECYFKPVFDWHEQRGMIYGCDHGGRGKNVLEFGDYFRTQKWNQAPGNDNPFLESDIIKNKVASSISHLYERERTWLEGFHSSGWGTSTADVADALFRNLVSGHNLLSLHGLYYSTKGGWWEWAPPCNHFRMPYREHFKNLLECSERLCYLLSQGVHRCDVALMYPVAPSEAGLGGEESVRAAFSLGEALYNESIDFDFMDFQSLERAVITEKNGRQPAEIRVAGEAYRILILPAMRAVRYSTMEKALEFHRAGGYVFALGCLPEASDHTGSVDARLDAMTAIIFGKGRFFASEAPLLAAVNQAFPRDFVCLDAASNTGPGKLKPWVMHRRAGRRDVYAVYHAEESSRCFFRAHGAVELWNPWTGETRPLSPLETGPDGTVLSLPLAATELQLIVFSPAVSRPVIDRPFPGALVSSRSISGSDWEFKLVPTRDNRYGDFSLPATPEIIGAEVHRLRYQDDNDPPSQWRDVSVSYGPHFLLQGPFPDGTRLEDLREENWKPYEYSLRLGIEGDPGHQGYHGLKGELGSDCIALGRRSFTQTGTEYLEESEGPLYFLKTSVFAEKAERVSVHSGTLRPDTIRLNGHALTGSADFLDLVPGSNMIILEYRGPGKTRFILETSDAPADWIQKVPLAMPHFRKPGVCRFDPYPDRIASEQTYCFRSPPALEEMQFLCRGQVRVFFNGAKATVADLGKEHGDTRYHVRTPRKEAGCSEVCIKVSAPAGFYGGSVFPEAIRLTCGRGTIDLGDWSAIDGLYSYSGSARYRKTLNLALPENGERLVLNLGDLVSSAEVTVNGQGAGIRVCPPWKFDITALVREGSNRIEVLVCNTLANHYTTIPTRYRGSLKSGLIGPVMVETLKTRVKQQ